MNESNEQAIAVTEAAASSAAALESGNGFKRDKKREWRKDFKKNWSLYLLFIPAFLFFGIFCYVPMLGILMAFQDVDASNVALFGDEWIGWENFERLFTASVGGNFPLAIRNTVVMALLSLTIGFIVPVILALLVSEVRNKAFRRFVQTVTYMPYFITAVIICQIVKELVGNTGAITELLRLMGYEGGALLGEAQPPTFWLIYLFTDIWQNAGYSSIVFVAAIAAIDTSLYEAAALDGANRWHRIWYVTLPSILPTTVMMFTIKIGTILTAGFDKVVLLYNPGIWESADTIFSYTYRLTTGVGGASADFGLAAASGLFQSVISVTLLLVSNWLSKLVAKTSLF